MRLGLNIEYGGKNYDILELPHEAFVQMVPGFTGEQIEILNKYFEEVWPEPTRRRHHILAFGSYVAGEPIDILLLNRDSIEFDEVDMAQYVEHHTKKGHRPS